MLSLAVIHFIKKKKNIVILKYNIEIKSIVEQIQEQIS